MPAVTTAVALLAAPFVAPSIIQNVQANRARRDASQRRDEERRRQEQIIGAERRRQSEQESVEATRRTQQEARRRQRALAQGGRGRQSTILTSPLGVTGGAQQFATRKTILGA